MTFTTSFSVGSTFRIIDEASPTLRLILRQVRELNVAPNVCCWENSGKH